MASAHLSRRFALLVILGLTCASRARADTEQVFQSWTAFFGQGRTKPGADASPGLWLDVHARRMPASTVAILRPGLGHYFDRRFSVWAGYAFVPTFADGAPDRVEHRTWEQLQAAFTWGATAMTLRTRFEQRWVHHADEMGLRARQLVRLQQLLGAEWALVVWDELFLGLHETAWGQAAGLDQNRAFAGAGWIVREGVRLEPGYLLAWIPRDAGNTLVHALSVNLFATW